MLATNKTMVKFFFVINKLALEYASENSLTISHIEEINLAENQEKKYKSINKVYGKIYYNNK